jgi:hypothetical protein
MGRNYPRSQWPVQAKRAPSREATRSTIFSGIFQKWPLPEGGIKIGPTTTKASSTAHAHCLVFPPNLGRNYPHPQREVEAKRTRSWEVTESSIFLWNLFSEVCSCRKAAFLFCPIRAEITCARGVLQGRACLSQSVRDQGVWNDETHHPFWNCFPGNGCCRGAAAEHCPA